MTRDPWEEVLMHAEACEDLLLEITPYFSSDGARCSQALVEIQQVKAIVREQSPS